MTAAQLIADLDRVGIRLQTAGDELRFHPRWAVTPDILARLLEHKAELLVLLRPVEIGVAPAPDMPLEWIEPDEDVFLPPCPTCGGSELWETILGEWKCQHCDKAALERSRKLLEKAARLRQQSRRRASARRGGNA